MELGGTGWSWVGMDRWLHGLAILLGYVDGGGCRCVKVDARFSNTHL